ncbi:MAG: hypothetical protein IKA50_00650 [Clostridia bacterium]|nr:hypothetical protein [Clostridia bacterium]
MKNTAIRILTLMVSLTLLLGALPLSVAAEGEPWDGSARTFKMKAGDEKLFIYTPSETGAHTIERQYSVLRVNIEPATDKDGYPEMIDVSGKASPNDECYRLTAGVPYRVRIYMHAFDTDWPDGFEDTIAIRPGMPVLETDLATPFPASGTLKLKVKAGEEIKYKFTPSESGTYVLYSENTVVDLRVRSNSTEFLDSNYELFIANPFGKMFGYMLPLTAGETYLIVFSLWEGLAEYKNGFEDTYYLKKTDPLKSVSLRSAHDPNITELFGYVGGDFHLFGYTDPLYYQSTITDWSISDTSVAAFEADGSGYVRLKKAGTVTVTAKVAGQTAKATITVKERPVLELNKTTTLTFGGSLGAECTFTPSESGTYRFSMTGAGGTTEIRETGAATYWEGSGSLSAYLTAGKTYTLVGAFGPNRYTVKVTKGGSSNPTNALPSGDEPTHTTTTQPTDKTNPSQPTDKTNPSQATGTTQKEPTNNEGFHVIVKYEDVLISPDSTTVIVEVEDAAVTTVGLSTDLLDTAVGNQQALQIVLPHATVTLDTDAVTTVAQQGAADLTVLQQQPDALNKRQQTAMKSKKITALVSLTLTGDADIHELGGTATVSIPFTAAAGTKAADYAVYYINEIGDTEKMETSIKDGRLTFTTDHFSDYAVVYEPAKAIDNNDSTKTPVNYVQWALFSLLALVLMIGGGVTIYFITKHQASNNGNH